VKLGKNYAIPKDNKYFEYLTSKPCKNPIAYILPKKLLVEQITYAQN